MKSIGKVIQFLFIYLLVGLHSSYTQDDMPLMNTNGNHLTNKYMSKEIMVNNDITVAFYFQYLDSIVEKYKPSTPYPLSEHVLVRANPWIIDSLINTDYYRRMSRGTFIYDQKQMIVLPKGAIIKVPSSEMANQILNSFQQTTLDINIPEFKLRIYEGATLLYEFPIRVGKNEKKYLKMSGRIQDLRTKIGNGHIVNHNRNPRYINPVDNHEYFVTKRDDERVTKLPQIPFIETEINSLRNGQLIHPTTNPITLGKAYSNGCIGTNESDAWVIYYYAPIGTKIKIRYDLNVSTYNGEDMVLYDIYNIIGQNSDEK